MRLCLAHFAVSGVSMGPLGCRYRGEQLARKTQQLYLRLNAPLNDIKREISALQRTIQQGGSGSSRKKLRSLVCCPRVQ